MARIRKMWSIGRFPLSQNRILVVQAYGSVESNQNWADIHLYLQYYLTHTVSLPWKTRCMTSSTAVVLTMVSSTSDYSTRSLDSPLKTRMKPRWKKTWHVSLRWMTSYIMFFKCDIFVNIGRENLLFRQTLLLFAEL